MPGARLAGKVGGAAGLTFGLPSKSGACSGTAGAFVFASAFGLASFAASTAGSIGPCASVVADSPALLALLELTLYELATN